MNKKQYKVMPRGLCNQCSKGSQALPNIKCVRCILTEYPDTHIERIKYEKLINEGKIKENT